MRQINPIVQSLSHNAWMSIHLSNKQLITRTINQYKGFLWEKAPNIAILRKRASNTRIPNLRLCRRFGFLLVETQNWPWLISLWVWHFILIKPHSRITLNREFLFLASSSTEPNIHRGRNRIRITLLDAGEIRRSWKSLSQENLKINVELHET